ncbi:MAG TPA: hypothetical protein VFA70_10470 [Dehalococcoidia bacterium]|nr:hypothetical protein [Dehalococcoidia bacterium]
MSDEELDRFVAIYPHVRAAADALYIPEVRYAEPALIFSADWPDAPPPGSAEGVYRA